MDAIPRHARLVAALLTLALALAAAACSVGPAASSAPSVAPSTSAPPDTPVTAPPSDPSADPSIEPPVGAKPIVPKPGQAINVHPVSAESLSARVDGSTINVTATWWSGVEPCTILDSIVVDKGDGTYTVTLREGSSPQEIACIALAEQHTPEFEIPNVPAGTWKILDSGGVAPPVEVTVG
jgi:ABC-type transport system substrate-binding protein